MRSLRSSLIGFQLSFLLFLFHLGFSDVRGYTLDNNAAVDAAAAAGDQQPVDQGYNDYNDYMQALLDRIAGDDVRSIQKRYNQLMKRRLCILPTMSCNVRPNSCCPNTTCRCNLWGQNCRCLRMGLFQRWGR